MPFPCCNSSPLIAFHNGEQRPFSLEFLFPLRREHCAEPVEPALPQGTTLHNPPLGDLQAGWFDTAGAYAAHFRASNQAALFEQLEVLNHGGNGDLQRFSKVLRGPWRSAQLVHNGTAHWVSEGTEHTTNRRLVKH
jgi:hypothetical protein